MPSTRREAALHARRHLGQQAAAAAAELEHRMRRVQAEQSRRGFGDALDAEANAQREAGNSQDAVIGAVAFLKKEKPEFTGQ